MEFIFLLVLLGIMAFALASGFPVAFALPGSAIITIVLAGGFGYLIENDPTAFFVQGGPINWLTAGVTNFRGIYWEVERDTLIAIPLFIFMGIMLQRSKIAEDLLITMAQLFGRVRGGLGISVVFVGALLAATTGIVGATVVAMGLISLPAMLKNKYSHGLATGTIAASGTLGQIIPPSIVLIILADQLSSAVDIADMARKAMYKENTGQLTMPSEFGVNSTSAGDMFMGALLPGLVLVLLYMLYILVAAYFKPNLAPAVPLEGKRDKSFIVKVFLSLIPPLTLIFIVLGSIIGGIATVNQAGAIGAVGALIMAGYRLTSGQRNRFYPSIIALTSIAFLLYITSAFDVNVRSIQSNNDLIGIILALIGTIALFMSIGWSAWRAFKIDDTLQGVMLETAKTTSLVFIILLGAAMLTAAFRGFGGEDVVKDFLIGMPGGFWSQFIIVMLVIFVLGFFLDFIEIAVVVVPIVAPILLMDPSANITAVWLGVMIGLNIQTSFLTPPFGFALFYLRGVASKIVTTVSMYKGVVPFISLQIFAMMIVGYVEPVVNYLPTRLSLLGNSPPPPMNPKLQTCIEDYLFNEFKVIGADVILSTNEIKKIDISYMVKRDQQNLIKGLNNINSSLGLLPEVKKATNEINVKAELYKPIRNEVRFLETKINKAKDEVKKYKSLLQTIDKENDKSKWMNINSKINEENLVIQKYLNKIPKDWKKIYKEFNDTLKKEKIAQIKFRKAADKGYEELNNKILLINDLENLASFKNKFNKLIDYSYSIQNINKLEYMDFAKNLSKDFRKIKGSYKIVSQINKSYKEMRKKSPKYNKVKNYIDKAFSLYQLEEEWRLKARGNLLPKLVELNTKIKDNIGLRKQSELPVEQAKGILVCQTFHRDLSLYF